MGSSGINARVHGRGRAYSWLFGVGRKMEGIREVNEAFYLTVGVKQRTLGREAHEEGVRVLLTTVPTAQR